VRSFFIHHLQHVEKLFLRTAWFLKQMQPDTDTSPQRKLELLLQANELWNQALETVFAFRTKHTAAYGILPEFIEDGILIDVAEYVDLPEFWTSTDVMLKAANTMCKISRDLASDEFDKIEEDIPEVLEIGRQNPRVVELLCHIYQERINWVSSRSGEKNREKAEKLRGAYEQTRHDEFRSLAAIAQTEAGMKLAEKYKDMLTLTELVVSEIQYALEERPKSDEQRSKQINQYIGELTVRTTKYFDRFGDDWANAYFDFGFSGSHAGIMLQLAHENWPAALTKYLRADLSRAKLCWIDDIWAKKDFTHAQKCLGVVAKDQETKLWPKKIELSLSKLALLAAYEETESGLNGGKSGGFASVNVGPDIDLEIVHIQEALYKHFMKEIGACIDSQAELEIALQKFGLKNQDLGALRQVLEAGVERLLSHTALSVEELIDVLTLMDSEIGDDDDNLQGQEFFLALRALDAAAPNIPQPRFDLLLQLIWKRCYIYDDWVELNGAAQKKSGDEMESKLRKTVAWRTLYHAFDQDLLGQSSNVRLLTPSECLGAGCLPEELEYRWPELDILHPILHDNKIQDEQLQGFATDRRLDDWIDTCCESVKRELEAEAEENAQRLLHEREFEEAFELGSANGHEMNGHTKGPNGIEAGEDGEHSVSIEAVDQGEDVEMG
jgi:nuclear pore complex protein Nup133